MLGTNSLGAILADGWYSGYVGFGKLRDHYGKHTRFKAQLHLEYADGSTEIVATGTNWKVETGPIAEADFLMGETYDARAAVHGWDDPGFDDSRWTPVVTGSEVKPLVEAHPGPPVRPFAELRPRTITEEPKPGVYVLDLGQNFAGVPRPRLKIHGEPGQRVTLRFAERLSPDGTIYTTNLRSATTGRLSPASAETGMAQSTRPTFAPPAASIRTSAMARVRRPGRHDSHFMASSTSRSPG